MIFSDQIHVAMTKTSGLVVTLACQSNTFYQINKCNETSSGHEVLYIFFLSIMNQCHWISVVHMTSESKKEHLSSSAYFFSFVKWKIRKWSWIWIKIILPWYNNHSRSLSAMWWRNKEIFHISFKMICMGSRFPKKSGVHLSRRHCRVQMIRDAGPSILWWS